MTRGRKKDLTIPPTRSLVQQRDYRARKAHYVAELEQRCKKAEEENKQLRQELELARANMSVPFLYNPLAAEMSAELLQSLTRASDSLVKFQDFARRNPLENSTASSSRLEDVRLPPLQEPFHTTPHHLPPILPPVPSLSYTGGHQSHGGTGHHPSGHTAVYLRRNHSPRRGRKRFCLENSPSPLPDDYPDTVDHGYDSYPQSSPARPGSNCCGGYIDGDCYCDKRSGANERRADLNEGASSRYPPPPSFTSSRSSSGDR
ncbi:hypothetical protein CC1G_07353 [Coprinopsis cinerea okayama7|uniref:BZIP domain-containing protein n=1 Tax=Coprinopsis cinerea (strain Okayama-7 / 130 / ATCC MYA-4618 / FGSC 9003) TaxID=240176 RepID=A8N6I2_COPC7|nr:hypothetical protein CC1G_07353 [Coprinopsis cinerea okayama7\|eukprot:XP_001830438.1 hypothetical protein CC1G_07353 [Coprinopsis cinerea okayama7\